MSDIFNYSKWPWAEESNAFPLLYKGEKEWPKLSVIIPSFNQGFYIEETILSVLKQNYPRLELIIIDGGSTDQTVDIIKKYEKNIAYWVSEKDKGQSHAINKGLERSTGDWVAWLNSDDCYLKNGLYHLFVEADMEPYQFLYGNYRMGESLARSKEMKVISSTKLTFNKVIRFFYGVDYIIPSQSVFIRRELVEKVGLLNEDLHYCMDVDWYARILLLHPPLLKYNKTLCFFRYNTSTKTGSFDFKNSTENKMGVEAETIAQYYYKHLNFTERLNFKSLYSYYLHYSKEPWKHEHCSLWYLVKLILFYPVHALSDRRILGLLKRKLLLRNH